MPRSPIVFQVSRRSPTGRKQPGADRRPAETVEPQRAVGFDDEPCAPIQFAWRQPLAKSHLAGHAVAARHGDGAAVVGRAPGEGRARGPKSCAAISGSI